MNQQIAFLLVTCSKECSRAEILKKVVANLCEQAPFLKTSLTVFDNASTENSTVELLRNTFDNVYQSNKNVGYWSAIDWWLEHVSTKQQKYTYIIESDVIHYDFDKIFECVNFLNENTNVGSVRLLEYSVTNRHLYNKDRPVKGSRICAWQSHTNKVTGESIELSHVNGDIWKTNFLTQLCALNRYDAMYDAFKQLKEMKNFSEFNFQKIYWDKYDLTGMLDGGIFHGELSTDINKNAAIGSWTSPEILKQMGYQPTRFSSITSKDEYIVTKLS